MSRISLSISSLLALTLAACGGGGSSSDIATTSSTTNVPTTAPASAASLAQQCAPDNPYRGDASTATRPGTLSAEKQWIRSYLDEAYLWYDSVPTVDPSAPEYSGPMTTLDSRKVPLPLSNYFSALKTRLTTPSGAKTDRFSFTYPTKAWQQLSQSGLTSGYGVEWVALNSLSPNRLWRVAMVQPGSPAAAAGILRGDTLKTVDGVDFANGTDSATLNAGVNPVNGTVHQLVFSRTNAADISVSLTATRVTIDPVPVTSVVTDPAGRKVGYLHFTDHIASSESKLIDAIQTLKAQSVADLVLDLRYNGGGYLYLASELSYMIAGPNRVAGKFFEKLQYNAKRTSDNAAAATPFYDGACLPDANGYCTTSKALPSLDLPRVFVIATGNTCSASESVINALRGINVDVQLIGSGTCGKPYGFTPKDNCGVSYFPIEFRGINAKGFGDYADGFAPTSGAPTDTSLPGCSASDDLDKPLGNTSERMLSAALNRAATGSCPASTTATRQSVQPTGVLQREAVREVRVLTGGAGPR